MKKIYTTIVAVLAITQFCYGQNSTTWPSTGNVGIGISNPFFLLDVWGNMRSVVNSANGDNANFIIGNSDAAAITGDKRSSIWLDNDGRLKLRSVTGYGIAFRNTHNTFDIVNITDNGIGVGTTTPAHPLDVNGVINSTSYISNAQGVYVDGGTGMGMNNVSGKLSFRTNNVDSKMVIDALGNVGIGTASPNVKLDVQGDFGKYDQGRLQGLRIGTTSVYGASGAMTLALVNKVSAARNGIGGNAERYLIRSDGFDTYLAEGAGNLIYDGTGSFAIGTIDPKGYKLAVNGSAVATSMTVKLNGSWPDYVFRPSYVLPSLNDVKSYIDRFQRLPEMPSDKEVEKNGIELGEIVKLQTKKIEELTLYLIEKDKQMKDQQDQLNEFKKELKMLKNSTLSKTK